MRKLAAFVAGVALVVAALPAFAHHPFMAEFDWKKPITLNGTVTRVEWTNPHAFLHLDVKDATGAITTWTLELGSPGALTSLGWTRRMLKAGDQVTVDGWAARNKNNVASVKSVMLSDGRELYAASSFFEEQRRKPAKQTTD